MLRKRDLLLGAENRGLPQMTRAYTYPGMVAANRGRSSLKFGCFARREHADKFSGMRWTYMGGYSRSKRISMHYQYEYGDIGQDSNVSTDFYNSVAADHTGIMRGL